MDYPFTSWSAYYAALTESLCTAFYRDKYPKYAKQIDKGNTDAAIVKDLLEVGCNPQEGLNGFMQALLEGSRYAADMPGITRILELFIHAGATPNVDFLFQRAYPEEESFEDEIQSYVIRGILIDHLQDHIEAEKYYDWSSIEDKYWEHINKKVIKKDYKKACYMYLKSCSQFLQEV